MPNAGGLSARQMLRQSPQTATGPLVQLPSTSPSTPYKKGNKEGHISINRNYTYEARMSYITVAAATLPSVPLDFEGNLARILESLRIAKAKGAKLRTGPEVGQWRTAEIKKNADGEI